MCEFFVGLGFTQARIDILKRDQLLDLLVAGLRNLDAKTSEERETIKELAERLTQLKSEPVGPLPAVKHFDVVLPDPEDEASLQAGIRLARERVGRELDAEREMLAKKSAA
jgi:hypothetical protein